MVPNTVINILRADDEIKISAINITIQTLLYLFIWVGVTGSWPLVNAPFFIWILYPLHCLRAFLIRASCPGWIANECYWIITTDYRRSTLAMMTNSSKQQEVQVFQTLEAVSLIIRHLVNSLAPCARQQSRSKCQLFRKCSDSYTRYRWALTVYSQEWMNKCNLFQAERK